MTSLVSDFLSNCPNIWPVVNTLKIMCLKDLSTKSNAKIHPAKSTKSKPNESPKDDKNDYTDFSELFVRHLRLSTYWIVAYFSMLYTFPSYNDFLNDDTDNDPKFYVKWAVIVLLRDFLIILVFWSSWHYLLYDSPFAAKLKPLKYNKEYPPQSQWIRSRNWAFVTGVIESFYEIIMIYILKQNKNLLYESFWCQTQFDLEWIKWTIYSIFWLWIIPYILDAHFYWFHRAIHPWKWNIFAQIAGIFGLKNKNDADWFDPGYFLYKYVHKHHHIDVNMGPWSAISVHPIEALLVLSGIFIPIIFFIFPQHSIHFLFNKYYGLISTLPNHDGFQEPGGASYFHYLHHAHFECNYGSPMVPFDRWFGSFEDGQKYKKKK